MNKDVPIALQKPIIIIFVQYLFIGTVLYFINTSFMASLKQMAIFTMYIGFMIWVHGLINYGQKVDPKIIKKKMPVWMFYTLQILWFLAFILSGS